MVVCGSCAIPAQDLTVSWFGGPGDGSTTLVFNGVSVWQSACTNGLIYELLCNAGTLEFRVIYFISGVCPTGISNFCSTLGGNPQRLIQTGLTCGASFMLTCDVTTASCFQLNFALGYTGFAVSA